MVDIPLTDEIKALSVSRFEITKDYLYLYNGQSFAQSRYYKNQLEKTLLELQEKMIFSGHFGDQKTVEKIILLLSDLYVKAAAAATDKGDKGRGNDERNRIEHVAFKYSKGIPIAEEITLDNKQNVFLQVIDDKPVLSKEIILNENEEEYNVLIPNTLGLASPILPYDFKDESEIEYFIEHAKKETIDSLFYKHKSIWKQIVVTPDKNLITLIATDSVYSFFQDKFTTTHYDMLVGNVGSGKGAILLGFKNIGYRTVLASDISGANILDMLGSLESNQVTLVEDELEDIYEDKDKLRIYKVGYDKSAVIPRTLDGNTSNRANRYYYPFGFKVFAAEGSPDNKKLEGFRDRIFIENTIKGKPNVYVKELENPSGSKKYQKLHDRINHLRKLSLIFRLVHHNDTIKRINTNIDGRALELTGPQLRLFSSNTLASPDRKVLQEILPVLSAYLRKKGELTATTLESKIYNSVSTLYESGHVDKKKGSLDNASLFSIDYEGIYKQVKEDLSGEDIPDKQAFFSPEYDKQITHRGIINICVDKFRAVRDETGTGKAKRRVLIFDEKTYKSVGESFKIINEIEIYDEWPAEEDDLIDDHEDKLAWSIDNIDSEVKADAADAATNPVIESNQRGFESGTELERNWNGIENKGKNESNTASEQGDIEGDDGSWNGRTEFHGDKGKTESKQTDSSNSNNTGQNLQDLQKSNCFGAYSTNAILDDNSKTNSVRIPFHFRSKFSLGDKQQNNQYPIRKENSVRQLHGGSN